MINHARTLLLNRDGARRPPPTFFMEEYVDPGFSTLRTTGALGTVYSALIGLGADDAFANYRLWQYMNVLHSTEFASYVYALDKRVTYLHDRSAVRQSSEPVVQPLNTQAVGVQLSQVGTLFTEQMKRLQYDWIVESLDASTVRTTSQPDNQKADSAVTFVDGLSSLVVMAGQKNFFVKISNPSMPVGAKWKFSVFSNAVFDLSVLETALHKLGDDSLATLFGSQEPFKTFKQLWDKHCFMQYRLSGFLLAFIYRMEEVRRRG